MVAMAPDQVGQADAPAPEDDGVSEHDDIDDDLEPARDEARDDAATDARATGTLTRARFGLVPVAVLGILVLVAVGFGAFQWRHAHDLGDRQDERAAAGKAAGQFGEALLTYDYKELNAARDRVLALATDRFGQEYTTDFVGALSEAIVKLQATSMATVRDVFLSDVQRDTARAIVTLDSEINSSAGTRRTTSSYLDMALVKQNGAWKIDSVISVAAMDQSTTPPGGATTTVPGATTVPSDSTTTAPLIPVTPGG
jgi:Mce-associated membrane protein